MRHDIIEKMEIPEDVAVVVENNEVTAKFESKENKRSKRSKEGKKLIIIKKKRQ